MKISFIYSDIFAHSFHVNVWNFSDKAYIQHSIPYSFTGCLKKYTTWVCSFALVMIIPQGFWKLISIASLWIQQHFCAISGSLDIDFQRINVKTGYVTFRVSVPAASIRIPLWSGTSILLGLFYRKNTIWA